MRLTKKIFDNLYASPCDEDTEEKQAEQQWNICNKLGQLEDLMEKYNIKTLEQVESAFIGFVSDYTEKGRNHIGELLKLENELGIDLITLSKLFKAQEVYAYGHIGIQKCSNYGVSIYNKTIAIYNGVCVREYPLSNYGKSFALTREELE